ncbi:hypothetical protein HMI01_22350 [Halolactibacillus miurensis]|uniref:YkyB-like protein n=1 Tax=Halolactibacillus miurensis TaxID=306541 RepID=A0A1I6UGN5_9BACI|nr:MULTISPECIES: hypothetical protein [Halolactibacillus]GEM05247.1 hypothetical protein HMI01_22350 [Halolactibacillus miurensis]SFT00548.1 hypothetical protein SAMN05421668_12621 [Halolactibacillus miurensis]
MEHYKQIPDHLATKTTLLKVHHRKITEKTKVRGTVSLCTPHGRKTFKLYAIEDAIPIKRRHVETKHFPLTDKTLSEALYIINKSAKKSRDAKNLAYLLGDHQTTQSQKSRQQNLYKLKDRALKILADQRKLTYLGYHEMDDDYLYLYRFGEYTFHIPKQAEGSPPLLNDLSEPISSEQTRKTTLKFREAQALIQKFLKENGENS